MTTPPVAAAGAASVDRRTLAWGLAGAVVTYLAHPPVGWSLLAWVGPAAWIMLCTLPRLPGRRPYLDLWLAGVAYWGLTIAWLRLPHPANWGALAFVASYLGLYLPTFVALTRVAVHRVRAPLWLAAPVVWTGLELARAHLLTGFLMGSLAQTQYRRPAVLPLAGIGGEYAVTFLMVAAASLIAAASRARSIARAQSRRRAELTMEWLAGAVVVGGLFAIGAAYDAVISGVARKTTTVRIALVQSDLLADWKGEEGRDAEVMRQQTALSLAAAHKARAADKPLDLIVWPETMFRQWLTAIDADNPPPREIVDRAERQQTIADLSKLARTVDANLLVGIDRVQLSGAASPGAAVDDDPQDDSPAYGYAMHNSSVGVTRAGAIVGTYDKMHLLPFGEYVPLVDWIPGLAWITPITGGATPGAGPTAIALPALADPERIVRYAPNICYETALPHLVRRQLHELAERGDSPDVLVNLTNDAWYWGSAELDMHLAAGVLRAVETRTPLVIAANRGLSAHIDDAGRIVAVTERDRADVLVADVPIFASGARAPTVYVRTGDWLSGACLVCCIVLAVVAGWRQRT
ncbi:MAG: apolipoprotein N-acyltransferase [Pirellulales bacterium]|nr:apolipoprotein N-acyltransferase [Pirellulales bacterium]